MARPHGFLVKKALIVIGILALAGFIALAWSFSGAVLPYQPLQSSELPIASPPAGMTLSAITTGSMGSKALFAFRGGGFGDTRDFTMTAFLVHHPKGDLLIDTGFGRDLDEHAKTMPWLMRQLASYKKGTAVGDQLASHDYPMSQLAGVILTHAHWDHVSGLDSLPGVKVWVSQAEKTFIDSRASMTELINRLPNINYREYAFNGPPYLGFSSSYDVWGDGSVVLVPAPGHTPGSIIAFVNLPTGARYAFLGDLVWQNEGIDLPAEKPWLSRRLVGENDDEVRDNIARMAAIHKRFPDMHMIPAHDARAAASIPQYPAVAH